MITNSNLKALGFVKRSEVATLAAAAAETLPAYADTLHSGPVVAVKIYDTGRDNDGGAWRKKCAGKSYYTEPTCDGKWLGRFATDKDAIMASAYYGPNLVTNPYYANGLTGWSSVNASLAVVGNSLRTTVQGSGAEAYCVVPSVVGKVYRISLNFSVPTDTMSLSIGNTADGTVSSSFTVTLAGNNTYVAYHKATTTSFSLIATLNTSTAGRTFDISSVSICESVVGEGDYFQLTSDNNFYKLSNSAVPVQVYRGGRKEFPAQVALVAEAGRVVIYDLTAKGCPMWIVLFGNGVTWATALNGTIYIAFNNGAGLTGGLSECNFIADFFGITRRSLGNVKYSPNKVSAKTPTAAQIGTYGASESIVSGGANYVDVMAIDGSPIDQNTGLPKATILLGTNGGVSQIDTSGTIYNITCTNATYTYCYLVKFLKNENGKFIYSMDAAGLSRSWRVSATLRSSVSVILGMKSPSIEYYGVWGWGVDAPLFSLSVYFNVKRPYSEAVLAHSRSMISKLSRSPVSPKNTMVAYIGNSQNTGWTVGDTRLASMASCVAETLTDPGELILNGTFATDASYWTAGYGGTILASGGLLTITVGATNTFAHAAQAVTTVVGRTYTLSFDFVKGSAATADVRAGTAAGGLEAMIKAVSVNGQTIVSFKAEATTMYISFVISGTVGQTNQFGNVSLRLADGDLSAYANGLIVNGTLTKTVVASGAGLTAYSGFSLTNYLEHKNASTTDFGTGDFAFYGWAKTSSTDTLIIASRVLTASTNEFLLYLAGQKVSFRVKDIAKQITSTISVPNNDYFLLVFKRESGTISIFINTLKVASGLANTEVFPTGVNLTFGCRPSFVPSPFDGSLALWRVTATPPTDAQIAQIYKDEQELFRPGAQAALYGPTLSAGVSAYDDVTGTTHVLSADGRSSIRRLVRTDYETAASIGSSSMTVIDAYNDTIIEGGGNLVKIIKPGVMPKESFTDKATMQRSQGTSTKTIFFDTVGFTSPTTSGSPNLTGSSVVGVPYVGMGVTGTGIPAGTTLVSVSGTAYVMSANATVTNAGAVAIAQNTFSLNPGYTTKTVSVADALKREGSTKDYTISSNGYYETITFATSPGSATVVAVNVSKVM